MRAFALCLLSAVPATAQDALPLTFPVACTLGETCMIQQLVDHDPGPEARDFLCGPMSYDGHQGTDIRVPDREALDAGVAILAAADGVVRGTRNGVPDTGIGGFPEDQDCGNGVLLTHANGWQTQYCHLAEGSVIVTEGQSVSAGQVIGTMGFSGRVEFPHLHITVRQNGVVIDPFAPDNPTSCQGDNTPLWATPVPVPPGGILSIGFANHIPSYGAIQAGTADARALQANGEAIVIWGFFHGGRAGDVVNATIFAPDGTTYHTEDIVLERTQAQLFRASGRRIRDPLPLGNYRGEVTLTRNGIVIDQEVTTISVR